MKKLALSILGLALFALAGCAVTDTGANPADDASRGAGEGTMVKLFFAKCVVSGTQGKVYGYIEVENAAYQKQVFAHMSIDGAVWRDVAAYFVKSLGGNKELWKFQAYVDYVPQAGFNTTFALKYVVNGQTYWDNNGGWNYQCALASTEGWSTAPTCAFGRSVVAMGDLTYWSQPGYKIVPNNVAGTVYVPRAADAQQVTVYWSTDNWKTKSASTCYHDQTFAFQQRWRFTATDPGTVATAKFYIEYTTSAGTAWDNNFGRDYTVVNGSINE